jgi:glycosyltransferase involved in cell wall biosynthesis
MSSDPLVSILIPVYNREPFIAGVIDCARRQTYGHIEIIVVDSCSTDGTWAIVQEFAARDARIKIFRNESNLGPLRNWRKCIDYASGEYGKILFSDDGIEPAFLERTLPLIHGNPQVGFVFTGVLIHYMHVGQSVLSYFIGPTGLYDSTTFLEAGLITGGTTPVSPGCALFRRADLDKNTLVHIANKIGVDFSHHGMGNDFLIYLLTANDYPQFGFVNEALSLFRGHEDSITIKAQTGTGTDNFSLNYEIARAFFVENHLKNERLKRRYYTRILGQCFSLPNGRFDFQLMDILFANPRSCPIDYVNLLQILMGKINVPGA